ncbi:MAG: primosomal protein DnaI [Candidatus Izemoplasmatales bacterium]|jgi:primosomal protein DnaI|nr:primosomal protein DnaI [Candidatus Izemoplasmatales bacterium]
MKRIAEYLKKVPGELKVDEAIESLLDDVRIRQFALKYDLKHDVLAQGINNLLVYKEAKDVCNACQGLHECKLPMVGMTPELNLYNGEITLAYAKCRYNTLDESKFKIDAMYVPKKVFNASINDFDLIGPERKEILKYILKFVAEYNKDNFIKGMYLSGVFGSGKTYILAIIANELAKKGFNIVFAYYPDLVRELKSSISHGSLEDKIEYLKKTDILFLDDIGGETPSGFIRDEVLGPILQHRVLDELPTFFSSNIKMKVLIEALAADSSMLEKSKAHRIYERIRELAVEFEISEKPHRTP